MITTFILESRALICWEKVIGVLARRGESINHGRLFLVDLFVGRGWRGGGIYLEAYLSYLGYVYCRSISSLSKLLGC